jgi:acyl-CoA thioesterase-1
MRFTSLISVLFTAFLLTACRAREVRIMPLGASYTAGLQVTSAGEFSYEGGYRRYLETLLEGYFQPPGATPGLTFDFVGSQEDPANVPTIRKHHEGHPGWRIEDIDQHAEEWVKTYQPDAILLLIGTNDILKNNHLETAPDRLDQLVGHLLNQNSASQNQVKWVFVSSLLPLKDPSLDEEVREYNAAIEQRVEMRREQGQPVTWVDMYRDSGVTIQELGDGIHPDAAGYEKMASVWNRAMIRTMSQGLGL